jgi:DNA-binding NarL/FixJ family response regulator
MKVLIADDSSLVSNRLAAMLSRVEGVEIVGETHSAFETINLIRDRKPEVVVMDVQIKGGRGIDVVQDIKKDSPSPIFVMLASHPFPQYKKRCFEAGADYYFDKSNEFEKITDVFKQMN